MPVRETRLVPIGSNTFSIRVDSYSHGEMQGMVDGPILQKPEAFSSFAGLVIMLDSLMDDSETRAPIKPGVRSFSSDLELEILFRHNHSWQGRLRWVEGNREAAFNSVLDLLILIESIFGE